VVSNESLLDKLLNTKSIKGFIRFFKYLVTSLIIELYYNGAELLCPVLKFLI
jgi:hypothetical protein